MYNPTSANLFYVDSSSLVLSQWTISEQFFDSMHNPPGGYPLCQLHKETTLVLFATPGRSLPIVIQVGKPIPHLLPSLTIRFYPPVARKRKLVCVFKRFLSEAEGCHKIKDKATSPFLIPFACPASFCSICPYHATHISS